MFSLRPSARLSTASAARARRAAIPIGTLTNSTQRQFRPLVGSRRAARPRRRRRRSSRPRRRALGCARSPRRKVVVNDRQRRGRDDRGAEALDRAGGEQPPLDWATPPANEAAENRTNQAEHEHPPASEQVGHPAAPASGSRRRSARRRSRPTKDRSARSAAPARSTAARTFTIEASITTTNCVTASSSKREVHSRGGC